MALKLHENWAEVLAVFFIALGLVLSLLVRQPALSYFSVILAGVVAGRVFYFKRFKEPIFPFILIILGFIVGYLIGSFWTNRFLTLFLFLLSFIISYFLHLKQILGSFINEYFIK